MLCSVTKEYLDTWSIYFQGIQLCVMCSSKRPIPGNAVQSKSIKIQKAFLHVKCHGCRPVYPMLGELDGKIATTCLWIVWHWAHAIPCRQMEGYRGIKLFSGGPCPKCSFAAIVLLAPGLPPTARALIPTSSTNGGCPTAHLAMVWTCPYPSISFFRPSRPIW